MDAVRLSAESKFEKEIQALIAGDKSEKPPGWAMTPRAAETYLMGSDKPVGGVKITPKYIGDASIIQVAIATLASDRALMLTGEPGTAKSWISEHLSAAISGTSAYVIQGTAGTSEEHIKYGWNYAMLLAEGPSHKSLVASPILRGMKEGKFARFEEITRTSSEIQDALISILSEKQIAIPELGEMIHAKRGFNIIATANTRDRGVNEMSAALKRRFNFVNIPIVDDLEQEIQIVLKRESELRSDYSVGAQPPEELGKVLVTVFQELRKGITRDGKIKIKSPNSVLSTAEAISVLFNGGILAQSFGSGKVTGAEIARALVGAVAKESQEDLKVLKEYCETVVKTRTGPWKEFYKAATEKLN
ncbi:MAG TPA: AAA family ATPase [Leptospiraceae bacterium]|nr:AAA family ATPase [Leptospirales bacterium]HMU81921.1 AAA family ATPase [Leptospiraceae bacterium]HMX56843.1 AAA family ATPase [Leptospiraceae bacterium]HNN74382.1 AAA family ATPase [Leptospiraceae bacterium]